MSAFDELATKYETMGRTGYKRALALAAVAVQARVEATLAPHHRSGRAEDTLTVTPSGNGLAVSETRYQRYIRGVPQGNALQEIGAEEINRAIAVVLA